MIITLTSYVPELNLLKKMQLYFSLISDDTRIWLWANDSTN